MAERKLLLLSDLDGVLAHSQPAIIEEFNRRTGREFRYGEWTSFDLLTKLAAELTQESLPSVAAWLYGADVMTRAVAVPGAVEAVGELMGMGVDVVTATSRPQDQAWMTLAWAKKYFPRVGDIRVRGRSNQGESGNEFKLNVVKSSGADAYVDDDPVMVETVEKAHKNGKLPHLKTVFLVDRPWNKRAETNGLTTRVGDWINEDYGWTGIVQAIRDLKREV
jgi:phosphoglycolate phosphatase-like HAD superfamily hydrolase